MNWLTRLLRRERLETQLDAELRDHFERLVLDYVRDGLGESDARRRARLEFGGLDQVKELCRDARGTRWFDELTQDVRYGWRGLHRHRSFAIVAVLTLALGVGANTAVFGVINALLLRPLPVPDPSGLISLQRRVGTVAGGSFSYPQVLDLAKQRDMFTVLCGFGSDQVSVGPAGAMEPAARGLGQRRLLRHPGPVAASRPPVDAGRRRAGRVAGGGDQRCVLDATLRPQPNA